MRLGQMKHPQGHLVEGNCVELCALDIELNFVCVYVPVQSIRHFLDYAWRFLESATLVCDHYF